MKKKVVSVMLTVAMAASMLVGCGSTGTTDTGAVDNAAGEETDAGVSENEKNPTAQPLDTSNLDGNNDYILAFYGRCQWRGITDTCR